MALSRRALYGFPPPQPPSSTHTVRMVPLTQGVRLDTAWPLQVPGSSISMTNFIPLEGKLIPRSRLSSINTIRGLNAAYGMTEFIYSSQFGQAVVWYSAASTHAIVLSTGSISKASFVSAGGLGVADLEDQQGGWQYAVAFGENLGVGENMLVAAGSSYDTLLCLYQQGGTSAGAAVYSYLTSAPKAVAVCAFDNYVLAFNTSAGAAFVTRVQWCVRGEPFNWTGEGSGFEDLLEMSGVGMAVRGMSDGRVILFSDREIWYGIRAAYPAQFQFYPLDKSVGCCAPRTIADVPGGLLFLSTDWRLCLLPAGGGPAQRIAPHVAEWLRRRASVDSVQGTWGLYDPYLNTYTLYIEKSGTITEALVLNLGTGEAGFLAFTFGQAPWAGVGLGTTLASNYFGKSEGVLFADSTGTVYSTNSTLAYDSSSVETQVVTSTWRSAPIATDLAGGWKQILDVNVDYQATSRATVVLRMAADGNTFETTGQSISLASAPIVGRAKGEVYTGGYAPVVELYSTSTGYELHRLDVTMNLGGRRV